MNSTSIFAVFAFILPTVIRIMRAEDAGSPCSVFCIWIFFAINLTAMAALIYLMRAILPAWAFGILPYIAFILVQAVFCVLALLRKPI